MRNAFSGIKFLEAGLYASQENEALDRVVDRGVFGHVSQRLDDAIASDVLGHVRILRPVPWRHRPKELRVQRRPDARAYRRFVRARSVGLNSTLDACPRRTSPTFDAMAL